VRVLEAREKIQRGLPEDAADAVIKAVADDMNRRRPRRTRIEQHREARVDANLVEQAVDLILSRGHKRHLGSEAFPRANLTGQPRLLDLQPHWIRECIEDCVGRITERDGPIEIEKDGRAWSGHEPRRTYEVTGTRIQLCIRSTTSAVTAASPRHTAFISAVRGARSGRQTNCAEATD